MEVLCHGAVVLLAVGLAPHSPRTINTVTTPDCTVGPLITPVKELVLSPAFGLLDKTDGFSG